MTFDTFTYAEGLKNSGIPEEQVRALTQELTKALKSEDLATKQDIASVRQEIKDLATSNKQDIAALATSTKQDIATLAATNKQDLAELKTDMINGALGEIFSSSFLLVRFFP